MADAENERKGAAYSIRGTHRPQDQSGHEQSPHHSKPIKKAGKEYTYQPTGLDAWDPKSFHPKPGDPVRITSGPGVGKVKKPFAYVEHAETGEFHGMVNRASLVPKRKKTE